MKSPILPERPLLISPTLAETIGLEETVMLQAIADLIEYREKIKRNDDSSLTWIKVSYRELESLLSFWDLSEIKRIQESLQKLGMIRIEAVGSKAEILLAINDQAHPKEKQMTNQENLKVSASLHSSHKLNNYAPKTTLDS